MAGNQNGNGWVGPAILAGVAGVGVWRSLSPGFRENVWRFVEAMAEEHERRKVAELAQAEQLLIPSLEDLNFGSYPLDISPRPIEPVVEASPGETRFQAAAAQKSMRRKTRADYFRICPDSGRVPLLRNGTNC